MNINIPKCSQILYDANIIVYYILFVRVTINSAEKVFKIPDLTDKSHKITRDLIDSDKTIITLDLILNEINKDVLATIVHKYCNSLEIKRYLDIDQIEEDIEIHIFLRARQKLKKLLAKEWFGKLNYVPLDKNIETIKEFYLSLEKTPKMKEHMRQKITYNPIPSYNDMALLCCSMDNESTLVSNDTDITKFVPELKKADLYYDIVNLSEYR